MFHKRVMQLISATVIAELAVAVMVWTICPPSENTWRTYFAFRRSLLPALVATGVIIGSFHVMCDAKKPFGWLLATLIVDTFGLVAAARIGLAIAMQASLSIAFTSPWNTPLQFLGGIKPFQVVDIGCVFAVIPSMILLMGLIVEWLAASGKRFLDRRRVQARYDTTDASSQDTVVCGVKHCFSVVGAAGYLKAQVKAAVSNRVCASCGDSVRCNINWHDSDNTVEVEVLASRKDSGDDVSERNERLALDLADLLSRIDAECVTFWPMAMAIKTNKGTNNDEYNKGVKAGLEQEVYVPGGENQRQAACRCDRKSAAQNQTGRDGCRKRISLRQCKLL